MEGPNLLTTFRNLLFPILERLNCVAYVVHTHVARARFIAAKLEAKSMPSAGVMKLRATDRIASKNVCRQVGLDDSGVI